MRTIKTLLLLVLLGVAAAAAVVWSGIYNVGADDPHWAPTWTLLEYARTRAIETRADSIDVPDLSNPELIRNGAGNYSAMCVTCHLSPGAQETELSIGLYPRPPGWDELGNVAPAEAFWVLKHGIKASGMPAWGRSMEDRYLWGMVAFMQQFPDMTEAEYRKQVAASAGHSHGGGESDVGGRAPQNDHDPTEAAPARSSFEPIDDPMATGKSDTHDDHSTHPH